MVHPALAAVGEDIVVEIAEIRGESLQVSVPWRDFGEDLGQVYLDSILYGKGHLVGDPHAEHEPADEHLLQATPIFFDAAPYPIFDPTIRIRNLQDVADPVPMMDEPAGQSANLFM